MPPVFTNQISGINVVHHGLKGEFAAVPNWQQTLGSFTEKSHSDFFFKSLNRKRSLEEKVTDSTKVEKRAHSLARRVCRMNSSLQVWDSFAESGTRYT